jgi:hypothetical protein
MDDVAIEYSFRLNENALDSFRYKTARAIEKAGLLCASAYSLSIGMAAGTS